MKTMAAVGAVLSASFAFAEITPSIRYFDNNGPVEPNDGKLTFGAGGVIEYQGDVELPYAVEASADLTIRLTSENETVRKFQDGTVFPLSPDEPLKIFENMDLAEWEPYYTIFDYNNSPLIVNISGPGDAHFIRRDTLKDGRPCLYAQLQSRDFSVCVKIVLIQDGPDVLVQTIYACYGGVPTEEDGQVDYDKSSSGRKDAPSTARPSEGKTGYGANHLFMRRVNAAAQTLTVTTNLTAAGALTIASGVSVKAYGPDAMTSAWVYNQALVLDGTLTFVERNRDIDFAGTIVGTNGTLKVVRDPMAERVVATTVSAADLGKGGEKLSSSWITLKENARLSSVTGVVARLLLNSTVIDYNETLSYGFKNDGKNASVVIEYLPKCAQASGIKLRQNGDNIEIARSGGWYTSGSFPDGYDFENNNVTTDPNWHSYGSYYTQDWIVSFAEEHAVFFSGSLKGLFCGTVAVEGLSDDRRGLARVEAVNMVPGNGTLCFGPYVDGHLGAVDTFNNYASTFKITGKSTLKTSANRPFATSADGYLDLEDSILYWNSSNSGYLNKLRLRDGASVKYPGLSNADVALGWNTSADWFISGETPSFVDLSNAIAKPANLLMCGGSSKDGYPYRLTVDDVTGDAEVDFTLTANLIDNNSLRYHHLYKMGAGTVLHHGIIRHPYSPLHIQEGTWLVGQSDTFINGTGVSLEGGTFAVAAGTTNEVAKLCVTASGGIEVRENASLSFADSSDEAWPEDAIINLSGDLKTGTLRFGTDGCGLTPEQVRALRYGGHRVKLREDGTVDPGSFGIVLIVR